MTDNKLTELQDAVEQEMSLLHGLPPARPTPGALGRTRAAVHAEALRLRARARRLARLETCGGLAAAVLLAIGLFTHTPARHVEPANDPESVWTDFGDAWEQTSDQLAGLVHEGWTDAATRGSDEIDLDDALDSIDATFERLEQL